MTTTTTIKIGFDTIEINLVIFPRKKLVQTQNQLGYLCVKYQVKFGNCSNPLQGKQKSEVRLINYLNFYNLKISGKDKITKYCFAPSFLLLTMQLNYKTIKGAKTTTHEKIFQ